MVASLFTEPPFWYYSDGWAMSKLPYLYRVSNGSEFKEKCLKPSLRG
jgi:hypothetical protein